MLYHANVLSKRFRLNRGSSEKKTWSASAGATWKDSVRIIVWFEGWVLCLIILYVHPSHWFAFQTTVFILACSLFSDSAEDAKWKAREKLAGGEEEERHRAFSIQRSLEQAMFIQSTDFFCQSNPPRVLAKTFQDSIHRLKSWVTRWKCLLVILCICFVYFVSCLLVCLP